MMNFDERDLLSAAEQVGFREIRLDLEAEIKPISDVQETNVTWESFLRTAGNPKIPTIGEAIAQVLTPDEAAAFAAHMRPLVETGTGTFRSAVAYLTATK